MNSANRLAEIHEQIVEFIDSGRSFAVALVLNAGDGSTPQKTGVRAIIDLTGKIRGTIGGGFVEAQTQQRAIEACKSKRPVVFDFHLDNTYSRDAGAICGGAMRILIDPTIAKDRACYARAAQALQRRERSVLLTTVRTGAQSEVSVQWFPQEAVQPEADFPPAEAIGLCLKRRIPRLFTDDSHKGETLTEVLVEPLIPKPVLLIVGGGHIGQALAHQAAGLDFDVTVMDDRPEFSNPVLFPEGATACCCDIPEGVAAFDINTDTYIVIVTRGHKHDAETLQACIHTAAAYVGMIGSERKVALIRQNFIESGMSTAEEFDRVFSPIGLDIGAITVPEIATSIAAQLVAVRRKGAGGPHGGDMVLR